MINGMRFIAALILLAFVAGSASARRISADDARRKAARFSSTTAAMSRSGGGMTLASSDNNYYVFNSSGGGFVIVSASDLTDEILGYSPEGSFDAGNLPDNFAYLLKSFSAQIAYAEKNNTASKQAKSRSGESRENIPPMLKSKWGQGFPYNMYCPVIKGINAKTGCVATAMAQIVAYHKSLTQPAGVHQNILTIDLDTCAINYDDLLISYYGDETESQKHAIAKLMKVCGYVLDMDYDIYGSGAYTADIKESLIKYFDYGDEAAWICRHVYPGQEEWENDIYNSLKQHSPVVYRAVSSVESHCWMCDGYEDGFFSMNWGWYGYCDGYYKLTAMDVAGRNFTPEGFESSPSAGHAAIVNLHPNKRNNDKTGIIRPVSTMEISGGTVTVNHANPSIYNGSISYRWMYINNENDTTYTAPSTADVESGKSISVALNQNSIKEHAVEPDIYSIIPVANGVVCPDVVYAGVTPYKVVVSSDKAEIQRIVDKIYSDNFSVTKHSGLKITVEAVNKNYPVKVFDFSGNMVYNGADSEIKLPKSGFYVVKNGSANTSFIIK